MNRLLSNCKSRANSRWKLSHPICQIEHYKKSSSNLSLISKLTERIVKSRLTAHLSANSLFNPNQSVYTKQHSTETTLLSIHNHIINAISLKQVTCLSHSP
jgi:hypothetical protein